MREFNKKNSEKLFLLRVCLPTVYEEIGDAGVQAIEQGWAKEQDYKLVNGLVHQYVNTALQEVLSFNGSMKEKRGLIKAFNFFLYSYIENKNPKNMQEVEDCIKEYYINIELAVKLGG